MPLPVAAVPVLVGELVQTRPSRSASASIGTESMQAIQNGIVARHGELQSHPVSNAAAGVRWLVELASIMIVTIVASALTNSLGCSACNIQSSSHRSSLQ